MESRKSRFIFLYPLALLLFALGAVMPAQYAAAENPQDKVRLAVFSFSSKGVSTDDAAVIRSQLVKSLEQTGRFGIMGDAAMHAVIANLGFTQLEDCQTSSCLALIGSHLGVQQVLHGTLEQQDSVVTLLMKLVNVETGRMLFSRAIQQPTAEKLGVLANDLAATTIVPESGFRWYYVAGAVLVASATIYLISKGVSGDKGRQIENPPEPPPPPGN